MTASPVFTKDHQTIGKQGVFFRAPHRGAAGQFSK
jgi:hypothetical protein